MSTMWPFLIVLIAVTIFDNRADNITVDLSTGAFFPLELPHNLPGDYQAGTGSNYKLPASVLTFIPSACGPNNTCPNTASQNTMYIEMGCIPSKTISNFCCPVGYDCDKAYSSRSKTQCQYKGKTYAVGAKLPDDPDLPCITNIVCAMKNKVPGFTYKRTKCPTLKVNTTAINLFSHTECCSTGTRSSKLSAKEFKCTYNNRSYPIGAQIPSPIACEVCICQRGYNGTLRAPWCRLPKCGYELDAQNIVKGYGRVNGVGWCCPFKWKKPSDSDVPLPNPNITLGLNRPTCTHGKHNVRFGEGIISTIATAACEICGCLIPPAVQCGTFKDCMAALNALRQHKG